MTRRLDIQGLRALAVALVVLAHAGVPWLNGGFVGVDVFFVISGYLITRILSAAIDAEGKHWYLTFLVKRLNRLLPALFIMLIVSTGLAMLLLSSFEFSEQAKSVGYAASWTSNLYFAFTTQDYFAELQQHDLFLHTWSLGVEEQFYIVWPLLLVIAYARGLSLLRQRGDARLLAVLVVTGVLSLALSLYWTQTEGLLAFYMMPSRAWEFSLGALVYLHEKHRIPETGIHHHGMCTALRLAGLAGILASAMLLHEAVPYPGVWALFPAVGTVLVIWSGSLSGNTRPRLLSHPALVWVGDRSYSWYLWHWPLLVLGFAYGLQTDVVATSALVLLSLFVAHASYSRIELPFWKGRLAPTASLRTLGIYAGLIVSIGLALNHLNDRALDSGGKALEIAKAARSSMPVIYGMGCDSWFSDDQLAPCIVGPEDAEHTLVLIGDSIGVQWFSAVQAIYPEPAWRIVVLTKSSCAMADLTYDYAPAGGPYLVCNRWRDKALDYLAEVKPDLVFMGSSARYGFSAMDWIAGTARILDRLVAHVGQIVIIPGTPQLPFDGPACIERWLTNHETSFPPSSPICVDERRTQASNRVEGYLQQATQQYGNAHTLRVNDLVCPGDSCAAWQAGGQIVFRDQQHLTDSFVVLQADGLADRLRSLGVATGSPQP